MRQPVNPTAKINWLDRHQYPHLGGDLNHDRPRSTLINAGTLALAALILIVSRAPSAATISTTITSPAADWPSAGNPFNSMKPVPSGCVFRLTRPPGRSGPFDRTRCLSVS